MATHDLPIWGVPDASGDIFPEPAEVAMTLGTAVFGTQEVMTMLAPTGVDIGMHGLLTIPQNYVGTPLAVIRGVVRAATTIIAFGFSHVPIADNETFDVAYSDTDLGNRNLASATAYADEDMFELLIALTPTAAFVAGDVVPFFLFCDDSVDTRTTEFHLTSLFLRYNDS